MTRSTSIAVLVCLALPLALFADANVQVKEEKSGGIAIYRPTLDKPLLVFHAPVDARPYLHPLLAPDGHGVLTEFSPGHHKHQTGIYCGLILGGFAGYVADAPQLGWRWAFGAAGLVGLAYALPLFWLLRNPERVADAPKTPAPLRAIAELFGNRNYRLLVLYFTLPAIAGWVIKDWMPVILKEQFKLSQGAAGVIAVTYVQLATIAGAVVGGTLADRWTKRTPRGRIYVSAIGMTLFLPALFGLGNPGTVALAIVFLVLFGIGWGFFDGNNMPILCQLTRPELRATGYGFMNLVSISCGGFGDWGFGVLKSQGVALSLIFGCFTGVALLSVMIVLLIKPQGERPDA